MTEDYLEIQRRNFEAQFGCLEDLGFKDNSVSASLDEDEVESDEEEDVFKGFSESEEEEEEENSDQEYESESESEAGLSFDEDEGPVVVKFSESGLSKVETKKKRVNRKGKILSLETIDIKEKLNELDAESEILAGLSSKEDMENMKKDIELQRLLSESHILAGHSGSSGVDVTLRTINEEPIGNSRAKAYTQRLRGVSGLAAENRKLEKMPMSMRKGMVRKEIKRVAKYEEEAKNSGTILAKRSKYELRDLNMGRPSKVGFKTDLIGKSTIGKKQLREKEGHRKKGLRINSVGRSTRNGLIISQQEMEGITGWKKGGKKKNGNGRKR